MDAGKDRVISLWNEVYTPGFHKNLSPLRGFLISSTSSPPSGTKEGRTLGSGLREIRERRKVDREDQRGLCHLRELSTLSETVWGEPAKR
jgi:hypothetical protein